MGRRLVELRIATKLALFVGLGAVTFAVLAAACLQMLQTVVMNGPVYQEIVRSKIVVADALPPPAYPVETHATAFKPLEIQNADRRGQLIRRISALSEDYATLESTKLPETPAGPAHHMDRVVQAAAIQTEELASAAQLLAERADRLRGLLERFRAAADSAAPWRGSAVPRPGSPAFVAASGEAKRADGAPRRQRSARRGAATARGRRALELARARSLARGKQTEARITSGPECRLLLDLDRLLADDLAQR